VSAAKSSLEDIRHLLTELVEGRMVPRDGLEPSTPGFSVLCSKSQLGARALHCSKWLPISENQDSTQKGKRDPSGYPARDGRFSILTDRLRKTSPQTGPWHRKAQLSMLCGHFTIFAKALLKAFEARK
jgi:hypothetical protein